MKVARHNVILNIIEKLEIETQEELAEELRKAGFNVTQATVSRDIKELNLIKILSKSGKYKYSSISSRNVEMMDRHVKVFAGSVLRIDFSGNIIVMKTIPGAAQGAAAAIDTMDLTDVVGCIAGDDTIFVVVRGTKKTLEVVEKLTKLIK